MVFPSHMLSPVQPRTLKCSPPLVCLACLCHSDARIQVRRRRLAARLTPVAAEKGWLLHVLPPEITVAVLACLDSSSMKSLRATSRQCHAIVSEHTTKLVLSAKGVQHFTTVPLYKVYPSLAVSELALCNVQKRMQACKRAGKHTCMQACRHRNMQAFFKNSFPPA